MYAGTTIDAFIRENPTWMRRANFWSRFTAIASVGVIHRGHTDNAMQVLQDYLPADSLSVSKPLHGEAGALYALGLIHAPLGVSRGNGAIDYLSAKLRKFSENEPIVHGASLGLGLAALGLQDEELYDLLFTCLTGSDAVGAEGAAVGCGMLMLGSAHPEITRSLLNMASEEGQKEKIIRGCAMALSLVHLGREDESLGLVEQMLASADAWVRLGGCYVLGMAYAGTEGMLATEKLLTAVVKDANDDVKRGAMTMMGFLHFTNPSLCLDLVRVMIESYNPHVRYGVTMALGIAGAGTGDAAIIDVLWEMRNDVENYVRQGAYIALGLVMVQQSNSECPRMKEFRATLESKIANRKEDVCAKFGCLIATGLIDAGGRNCIFSLHRNRHRLDKAVVGMFLFSQHWYWFPYLLMSSLALSPTCFIGLNTSLEMPEYDFKSNKPPGYFAPPRSVLQEKKENKTAVTAVVLSTTKKEEELLQRNRRRSSTNNTDSGVLMKEKEREATVKDEDGEGEEKKPQKEGEEEEEDSTKPTTTITTTEKAKKPTFEILHNPARVTAGQFVFLSHDVEDARYTPLKGNKARGVCILRDLHPERGDHVLLDNSAFDTSIEVPPPAPFKYP